MDADPDFISSYDSLGKYEAGKSESKLTGTDPLSWNEKSWVVGVSLDGESKAYDWNELKKSGAIRDQLAGKHVVLLLHGDTQSFAVYQIPDSVQSLHWTGETLHLDSAAYSFTGKPENPNLPNLTRIKAYQEFWHSWRTFQPNSKIFPEK